MKGLLKIVNGEAELFIKAKELQMLIASIEDEEIKKELLLKLNLFDFLQANIAKDLPDREAIEQTPSQAIAKFYAIVSSEKFCFYFSCLCAYKKLNLNSIDEIIKDKINEDKKNQIKNIIISFIRHADGYSHNALKLKRSCKELEQDGISFITLLCCNKIKVYENILLTQTININDIGVITSIYYKSLQENNFFKHHTLSDMKQQLINFESAVAQVEIRIRDYNASRPELEGDIFKYLGGVIFFFSLFIELFAFEDIYRRDNSETAKQAAKVMIIPLLISVLMITSTLSAQRAKVNFRRNLNVWSLAIINYLANKLGVPDQTHKLYSESFHFDKAMEELNSLQQNIRRDLESVRSSIEKLGNEAIVDLNYIETLESAFLIKKVYSYIEKNIIALARVPSIENFIVPILRNTSNITLFWSNPSQSEPGAIASQHRENQPPLQSPVESHRAEQLQNVNIKEITFTDFQFAKNPVIEVNKSDPDSNHEKEIVGSKSSTSQESYVVTLTASEYEIYKKLSQLKSDLSLKNSSAKTKSIRENKSEIEYWQTLRFQIKEFLYNRELKGFILEKDANEIEYLESLEKDPNLDFDNNEDILPVNGHAVEDYEAVLKYFQNYSEQLNEAQEDQTKQLKKQAVPLPSAYKKESLAPKLKLSDGMKSTSAKPIIELGMLEIQQVDDVRDSPAKERRSKKHARKHIQNKILTELSEPESDSVENTELHTAIINDNVMEVKAILKKQKKNLSSEEFKNFINEGNLDGNSPLHFAVRTNHTKVVKTLIRKGSNVNCKNNLGERPLHKAAKLGYVNIAKVLIEAGAELDAVSYRKNTALHYACDYLKIKMVTYLISLKVNMLIENQQQVTVLELLNGKQPSRGVETIKKMLNEYQASVIAEKIAQRFRVICKLNNILSPKKKAKKELLEALVREECKSSTKFCEWTVIHHHRFLDAAVDDIAKAIDKKTQGFKKEFKKPELIKHEIKIIIEQTITNIELKKMEMIAQPIPSNTIPQEKTLALNNFKSYLREGLYTSYIYYSLILAEIISNPNITNNQLLELLKNISPLVISGAGQIISSVAPSIPGLQTGIQQGANVVSALTPIAINQIDAWLTKRDNKKRKDEAQCFVNAFINKNNPPISFLNHSIFRIDQEKLDSVVNTMAERFEDQLLDLQPFHAETLAQYLRDRILKHLLDNRDQFEGESEWSIVRTGKEWWKSVQEKLNSARVPPPRLDLNKRCILAILMQGMGATDEQVLNIRNKEVYLYGYIVWSGIKVKSEDRKDEYDYYGHPDEKTRAQHSLYGYCLGTKEEVERREFKPTNPNFTNVDKDKESWKFMRDKGFFSEDVNKRNDKDEESNEELMENHMK